MKNKKGAYKLAKDTIQLLISSLGKAEDLLKKEYSVHGNPDHDYYLINKSFWAPRKSVDHTVLFKGFELNSLKAFLIIYKKLYQSFEDEDNVFEEFSFRTLHDMSFVKAAILYGGNITNRAKERYKLICNIDDFEYVSKTNPQWLTEHEKLFTEKVNIFKKGESVVIENVFNLIKKGDFGSADHEIKHLLHNIERELQSKLETPDFLNKDSMKRLYRGYSKLIHGNIYLIFETFSDRKRNRLQFRKTYWLLSTGTNYLWLTSKRYPHLALIIKEINNNYFEISKQLRQA